MADGKPKTAPKRVRVSQTVFPRESLERALQIPKALQDEFGGKSAEPHQVAIALGCSPTSSSWRYLCGASVAYGLTEGSYNAGEIRLAALGRSIVAPTQEGEDKAALVEAMLKPTLMKAFFEKYDRAKLPSASIAENVLVSLGVDNARSKEAYRIVMENARYAGVVHDTQTGPFVALGPAPRTAVPQGRARDEDDVGEGHSAADMDLTAARIAGAAAFDDGPPPRSPAPPDPRTDRVFISHGHNKAIVDQLKEIVTFGKYIPIVSVEHETTSKPVPDKVLEDMRSCFAGVINVHSEGELLDEGGQKHTRINPNVLIEIGAAMALYKRNYVLLVQKGIQLPSNLQGLYVCQYEGEKLDYDATMKLLKVFNGFEKATL